MEIAKTAYVQASGTTAQRACAPGRGDAELSALLPRPAADANKFTRGHLILVAGSAIYPGAACLAAAGGERAGAGYTEVFCAGKSMITVRGWRPSLVVRDWRTWKPARLGAPRADRPGACVIGCGFDAADASLSPLLMETVRAWSGPLLIDGGALGLLASATGLRLARARAASGLSTLLTPHGGEAAKLAAAAREALVEPSTGAARTGASNTGPAPASANDTDPTPIGASGSGAARAPKGTSLNLSPTAREALAATAPAPCELALALAEAFGAHVVLKGPDTFIASPDGTAEVMDRGTAALAKAGTGDVLAGVIGALLAQNLAPQDAAALGCALHAEAGRAAAASLTDLCVTAEDLIDALPKAVRALDQQL